MRNILALSTSTTTTPATPVRPTARVQRTPTRSTPAQDDAIGLASADAPTPIRIRQRRPPASTPASSPARATVDVHQDDQDDSGLLFGLQLAKALPAPATPTTSLYTGLHSTLTAGEFTEMLAVQRTAEEAQEDDPDVDVTGTGMNATATGQASAALVSAPDYHAGTYLALPPDCELVVPLPCLDRSFSFRATDRQTSLGCIIRRC